MQYIESKNNLKRLGKYIPYYTQYHAITTNNTTNIFIGYVEMSSTDGGQLEAEGE